MRLFVDVIGIFILALFEFQNLLAFSLKPADVAKQLHSGSYETLKGAIEGATEVVGTPVDIKEVHFFLHTSRDNGYPNHTIDPFKPSAIAQTNGNIYFLIHGWTQSREKTPWFRPLTEFLLAKQPDAHVVQVDWSKAAADNYAFAAFSTESVGKIIGNLLHNLVKENNVPVKNIVVIGHSLGGQITGWVGKRFYELTHTKLPRIIALDPAGPLFSLRPDEKRLNKNDAEVVMVLHSDGSKLGYGSACGTVDFFPNGGSDQPGCFKVDLAKLSTITDPIWCDHQRGYNLFVEAVKAPECFIARKCKNYESFKEKKCEHEEASLGDLDITQTGTFYLETSDKPPFIKNQNTVKNDTSSTDKKSQEANSERKQCNGFAEKKTGYSERTGITENNKTNQMDAITGQFTNKQNGNHHEDKYNNDSSTRNAEKKPADSESRGGSKINQPVGTTGQSLNKQNGNHHQHENTRDSSTKNVNKKTEHTESRRDDTINQSDGITGETIKNQNGKHHQQISDSSTRTLEKISNYNVGRERRANKN